MKNFIICLSKIEASLKTATDLKNQLEEYGADVELFEGTYGSDAVIMMEKENRKLHPWGIKGPRHVASTEINLERKTSKTSTPGVKGCFYSHYNLWKKCAELNEPIIIWEDDIVLSRPYTNVNWEDVLIVALGHPAKSEKYRHYLDTPTGEPAAADYYQSSMPGCCGYAIKPHAAKKLIEEYKNSYLPADNAINQHYVKIQIHNHVMGIALIKKDGKHSLTRTTFWNNYNV
jgi:GR25 family glycosyltransferase involved in LPS biosynthesis